MEIIRLVDKIYKNLKKDPALIFSENDLTCQIYKELIQDETKRVFTEWSVKKKRGGPGKRIGRSQFDIVVCNKKDLVFDGRNDISISYFKKIMELKVHWQTSGSHMLNQIRRDYEKLKSLSDEIVEKKYMIAFNLCRKDISEKQLLDWDRKLKKANIIFIYRFLNTRKLL